MIPILLFSLGIEAKYDNLDKTMLSYKSMQPINLQEKP